MTLYNHDNERDAQTEDLRYELKAQLAGNYLSQVQSWVFTHSRAFRRAYPARWINNIYFDTWDMDSLIDHLDGIKFHQKLRLRWYGEDLIHIKKAYLELKQKENRMGKKLVQELLCNISMQESSWAEVMNFIKKNVNEQFLLLIQSTRPVSISSFYREYFVTADGETRLTLDYHLKSFDQRFQLYPNLRYPVLQLDDLIVELKSGVETAPALADLIAEFPFRFDKYSKYISTMQGILE